MRLIQMSILALCLLSGCLIDDSDLTQEIEQIEEKIYPEVQEDLWPFFEKFEEEAAKRGLNIDLSAMGIVGVISEIDEDNVAGRCNYHSHQPELVTIDRTFWENSSEAYKEVVVFHELGHCQLLRDHKEDQDRNGQCFSIMASGVGGCQLSYTAESRATYLDELFDQRFAGDWFR